MIERTLSLGSGIDVRVSFTIEDNYFETDRDVTEHDFEEIMDKVNILRHEIMEGMVDSYYDMKIMRARGN